MISYYLNVLCLRIVINPPPALRNGNRIRKLTALREIIGIRKSPFCEMRKRVSNLAGLTKFAAHFGFYDFLVSPDEI